MVIRADWSDARAGRLQQGGVSGRARRLQRAGDAFELSPVHGNGPFVCLQRFAICMGDSRRNMFRWRDRQTLPPLMGTQAALKACPEWEHIPCDSFELVFQALSQVS